MISTRKTKQNQLIHHVVSSILVIISFFDRFLAISNFPARRQAMIEKVKKTADALACELEEAMRKDLSVALNNMESFVQVIAEPYQDATQKKQEKLLAMQAEISNVEKELQKLQVEIQNLHVS